MRLVNLDGRAAVLVDGRLVDIDRASGGRLPSDPMEALKCLDEVALLDLSSQDGVALDGAVLGPPVPRPTKILAAGGNYQDHLDEEGAAAPGEPNLFAKLPSALTGARGPIHIPPGRTQIDWEAELVVVIGRRARNVREDEAWSHVAGVTCGQDISDREEQFRAFQQWTMAKSFDTYAPTGPYLVTLDELEDRDRVPLRCYIDGEQVQDGSTANLIFSVPRLISWASHVCTLEPGDLFFTGTPGGVGAFREPPRWLQPGEILRTEIPGVGEMENTIVGPEATLTPAGVEVATPPSEEGKHADPD
jgi:2-keto-4-pentenoate hydratase/2-oxohepta-3-ene-1,7-dioic acid hydratase in catechol pathway